MNKHFFYFLMIMPLILAFSSCDNELETEEEQIIWGEITGNVNGIWDFVSQQSYATSSNALVQALLPALINVLNTTSEAGAYLFNLDMTYSQYWWDTEAWYEENGAYILNDRDLTLSYTDRQTGETKTGVYQIVSLSDTQLVLYKNVLGIWEELAAAIIEPFDKIGITPQSAYQIITYTKFGE